MNSTEIKALVSLLDDDDQEVVMLVEQKIRSLGEQIIPFLESEWEQSFDSPLNSKIEALIHQLQYDNLYEKLAYWKNGGAMDLLEGLWLVATYMYPDLTYEKLREEINQIYFEVWVEFKDEMATQDKIRALNHVFFNKLKFGANTKNFHASGNSMLNIVLESRKGNPISLCVIYMLIAQKMGMPVYGVNLPNLFVLTHKKDDTQFYINVFNKGLVFMKHDIDNYIAQLQLNSHEMFYEPCTHLDIVRRVLRNLIMSFDKTNSPDRVQEIQRLLKALE
jgi:regulator of sirC expression with transglutaminase-like and TPR domain